LSADAWYAAHIMMTFGGSDQGIVTHRYELPDGHPFSHELKAAVIGNPAPVFHFGLSNTTTGTVVVQCNFTLTVTGNAPLPRLDMASGSAKGLRLFGSDVMRSNTNVLLPAASELPGGDDDDESEDESPRVRGNPSNSLHEA